MDTNIIQDIKAPLVSQEPTQSNPYCSNL